MSWNAQITRFRNATTFDLSPVMAPFESMSSVANPEWLKRDVDAKTRAFRLVADDSHIANRSDYWRARIEVAESWEEVDYVDSRCEEDVRQMMNIRLARRRQRAYLILRESEPRNEELFRLADYLTNCLREAAEHSSTEQSAYQVMLADVLARIADRATDHLAGARKRFARDRNEHVLEISIRFAWEVLERLNNLKENGLIMYLHRGEKMAELSRALTEARAELAPSSLRSAAQHSEERLLWRLRGRRRAILLVGILVLLLAGLLLIMPTMLKVLEKIHQ